MFPPKPLCNNLFKRLVFASSFSCCCCCCKSLFDFFTDDALLLLLVAFILLISPNGKVDLISDRNNTYVYVDGEKIPCEEYSEYRAYDYCNDEWKMPMR